MRRDLGSKVLLNTILMMRQRSRRVVLLTESPIDAEFYQKFVSAKDCFVGAADGRAGVLGALEMLGSFKIDACVGIVDADADHALQLPRPHPDVYRTDKTDKETTIIDSPAFSDFCKALNVTTDAEELRQRIYGAAFPIGAVRRLSVRSGLRVDFKRIVIENFIHDGPVCIDAKCFNEIIRWNQDLGISIDMLEDLVKDAIREGIPMALIVQGHDLVSILSFSLSLLLGCAITEGEMEYELSKAYTFQHFQSTKTYADLRVWEQSVLPTYRMF